MSRFLHFHTYCDGAAGLNNVLMSIENGLIIGKLSNRRVKFYQGNNKLWSGNKIPQSTNKYIQDIYDIDGDFLFGDIEKNIKNIPINLTDGLLYNKDNPDEDFKFGRKSIFNISNLNYIDEIRTKSHLTLSFYSYLFFLTKNEQKIIKDYLIKAIKPKSLYQDYGEKILKNVKENLGEFNVIHVRRGNTMGTGGLVAFDENGERVPNIIVPEVWKDIPVSNFIENLISNLDPTIPLIILSDEPKSFYKEIIKNYKKTIILNQNIENIYGVNLNKFEELEKWFIFSFLAINSKIFIGTQGSTYSSLIQRQRLLKNKNELFKFLYVQKKFLQLNQNFSMKELYDGKYSWNKCYPKKMLSPAWSREWPEAIIDY